MPRPAKKRSAEEAPSVTPEPTSQPLAPAPEESQVVTRTRSGRAVKAPVRYVPVEVCEDDFDDDDYDSTDLSDVSSEASYDSEEMTSESDADDNGNLDGFVIEDKTDASDIESDVSGSSSESDDAAE